MARRKTRKKTRSSKARKKTGGAKAKIGQAIKLLQAAKKHTS